MNSKTFLFGLVLTIYVLFFNPFQTWDVKIQALALLVIIQVLWLSRLFPLAFSSLILIVLLSVHFFTYEETLKVIGSEVVWLLFATFILSGAFIESGLAHRISLKILALSKGSGSLLILLSYWLILLLSLLIPSNIGRGTLVASLLDQIMKHLSKHQNVQNLGRSLFIGLSVLCALAGTMIVTGASSTIYVFGILSERAPGLNYISWFLLIGPIVIVFTMIFWFIMISFFPPENTAKEELREFLDFKMRELGSLSRPEIKMSIVIVFVVTMWVTHDLHEMSISLIGLIGACLTILPKIGIWNWEDAKGKINWDLIIFFAATLMVSKLLIETDATMWVSNLFVELTSSSGKIVLMLSLVVLTLLLRMVFVNVLGFMTIMIPLAVSVGQQMSSVDPLMVALMVFVVGVPGFFFIFQSPVHLISHSYHYFERKDLWRVGQVAVVSWVVVVLIAVLTYWQLILQGGL